MFEADKKGAENHVFGAFLVIEKTTKLRFVA